MNLLVIIGDRTALDVALRKENITDWTVTVLGNELPFTEAKKSLNRLSTMDLTGFDAILLVNVHMLTYHSAISLAGTLVSREFSGKLLVFAEADKHDTPSVMRRHLRGAGVRDDQFAATIRDAIRELQR